jgi:hypothetical protein
VGEADEEDEEDEREVKYAGRVWSGLVWYGYREAVKSPGQRCFRG